MNIIFGTVMAVIGILFLVWSLSGSENPVYRLLIARSRMLWKDNIHKFYTFVGVILIVLGALYAKGIIWT